MKPTYKTAYNGERVSVNVIQQGNLTVAVIVVGEPTWKGQQTGGVDKRVFAGTAFRHPCDQESPLTAARVACRRALIADIAEDAWRYNEQTRAFRRGVYAAIRATLRAREQKDI